MILAANYSVTTVIMILLLNTVSSKTAAVAIKMVNLSNGQSNEVRGPTITAVGPAAAGEELNVLPTRDKASVLLVGPVEDVDADKNETAPIWHTVVAGDERRDPATVQRQIDAAYSRLAACRNCSSLLRTYLTATVKRQLERRRTPRGATLYDVIRSGVWNLDARIGVYAPDTDAYATFALLFDPIISAYHERPVVTRQPPVDYGREELRRLTPLDPAGRYIISTRIRFARSLAGFALNPLLSLEDYLRIQSRMQRVVESITEPELRQTYYSLEMMADEERDRLIDTHYLFEPCDRHMTAANACNFWPIGRGISYNAAKTFLVWVGEEDHVRLISMQPGGDVGAVFARLARGARAIEARIGFVRDPRLGWLTFCPTNLGSTVRASVHVRLRHLAARPDFKAICNRLRLQIRGVHGEHSEGEDDVYDISNRARWGISEFGAVAQMYDGVRELLRLERIEEDRATIKTTKNVRTTTMSTIG